MIQRQYDSCDFVLFASSVMVRIIEQKNVLKRKAILVKVDIGTPGWWYGGECEI